MPSASHRWCKRCHAVRIDKRAGLEMCQRCKRITLEERRRERHDIKARRALREQGVAMPTEPTTVLGPPPMPETATEARNNGVVLADVPSPRRTYRPDPNLLGQEMLLEIGAHYEDTRIPTERIAVAYGISNAMLSAVVDVLGLPRRGHANAGKKLQGRFEVVDGKRAWLMPDEPTVPEPVEKALENMLTAPVYGEPQPGRSVLEPKPEPVVVPRRVAQAIPVSLSGPTFEVRVQGTIQVQAEDMASALEMVKHRWPDLRITRIEEQG